MLTFSVNQNSTDLMRRMSCDVFKTPTTDSGREWLSEVWFKAMEGKVDENVNVNAYGYVCEQNTNMAKAKKETALLTIDEIDNGLKGVSEVVASYVDDNIDYIIESSEVKTLVREFLDMHDYLLVEEGIDLWVVVKMARKFNSKMVDKLRYLTKEYNLDNLIKGVLENKECLLALEGVIAC